jgi:adenylate kinase
MGFDFMNKFIICGPQGSGKGTQAELLCKAYNLVHISIGDLFRWHMANHTKLAAKVTRIMNEGRLVPDDIVEVVVRERLQLHDWNYGFVLDGFPRTRPQAEFLFESWNLDGAVYLDVPEEVVSDRVLKRAQAGAGGGFTKRADDNIAALRVRLKEFREKTEPLLSLFEEKNLLLTIDGNRAVEEVHQSIVEGLHLPAK